MMIIKCRFFKIYIYRKGLYIFRNVNTSVTHSTRIGLVPLALSPIAASVIGAFCKKITKRSDVKSEDVFVDESTDSYCSRKQGSGGKK